MQLISDSYRRLNEQMHETKPAYGITGQNWVEHVMGMAEALKTTDILDYGCGKSTLSMHLPFEIKQYDPAIPRFSDLPEPADFVVCTDVLEHIEPDLIGEVMDHLQSLTKRAIFATVSTAPANKHLPDGRNAHLIIEDAKWWLNAFWDRFEVVSFSKFDNGVIIAAEPRKGRQDA